jgi:pyridoxal phosphate enzyme (YggS family)
VKQTPDELNRVTTLETAIDENYRAVQQRITAACRRAGRDPASVTLVAVTKYARLEWVRRLVECGVDELGENRPQQLAERSQQLAAPVHWHLIGHLQRNKVRSMLPLTTLIHSADSLRLLEAIDRIARESALRPRVLIEINLSGEAAKHGFQLAELMADWDNVLNLEHLQIEGLMTMAAYSPDPETARPAFARLGELRNELQERSRGKAGLQLTHLSMGMTGDFEVAIEEGATLVRIGSALWEGLEAIEGARPNGGTNALSPP